MGLLAIVKFGSNPSSSSHQNGITSVVWSIEFMESVESIVKVTCFIWGINPQHL
jgi:hypothetical protein